MATVESTRLSSQLAVEVMHAHLAFVEAFPFTRMLGYFSIVALVECMYHIIPALDEPSCEDLHSSLEASLQTAYEIVQRVAKRHHVARHALSALERVGVLSKIDRDKASPLEESKACGLKPQQGNSTHGGPAPTNNAAFDELSSAAPDCSSLFADIPYLALSATEMNRTVDTTWPNSDDDWQAWFATHSIP